MSEIVNFRTNVLLKNIIGKDLITDDNVAVMELVKNSYDAGATVIYVSFNNITSTSNQKSGSFNHDSRIVVRDDGIGMSKSDLHEKWLNIAYSEKDINFFVNGRNQAGNKGVGRFSCDKLGKQLTLYTRTLGSSIFKLTIDWTLFEIAHQKDINLQDINLNLDTLNETDFSAETGLHSFEHGTILVITKLRESWDIGKLQHLRRDMERFVNPNQIYDSSSYSLYLDVPEYEEYDSQQPDATHRINGKVENKVFSKLNFRTTSITSSIDAQGEIITTQLNDRGRQVFELKEWNPYNSLKNIKITVYYLNPYAKRYFREQTGFRSLDFGSIFLFVNGFRIPPYGDVGNDWLGMDARKGSGIRRYLASREVVGQIEIWDEDKQFQIITSRTGVKWNTAYAQLTKSDAPFGFFYKIFRCLERFVVEGIQWDKTVGDAETSQKEEYVLDDLSRSTRVLSVIRKIISLKDEDIISLNINNALVEETIQSQINQTKSEIAAIVEQLSTLSSETSPEALNTYMNDLSNNADKLKQFLNVVSKFGDQDQIHRLEGVRQAIYKSESQVLAYKARLEDEQKARAEAEAENQRLKIELEFEREKVTYLSSSSREMSEDAKGMVHNIKIIAKNIKASLNNLFADIQENSLTQEEISKRISSILFQNEKSLTISNLITRANFKADRKDQMINVVGYITDYLNVHKEIYEKNQLDIVVSASDLVFVRKLSVLDLAVVFDNLISNSSKAGATRLFVEYAKPDSQHLSIKISDDGRGVDKIFSINPDRMFDLGVTTTDGSGIGLHTVRNVLKEINSTITYEGTRPDGTGAVFNIIISNK